MKTEQKQEWDANTTLCIFPIYHSTSLPTVIHNACRGGVSSVSIPFFFFHQSSLYIQSKYLQNVFINMKDIMNALVGEVFQCDRDHHNAMDP